MSSSSGTSSGCKDGFETTSLTDSRQDPAVVSAFAQIWGTQELLASYDGINISLPIPNRPVEDFAPWPHVDQSPLVKGLHCVQGIVNLLPNGAEDGGLMVSLPGLASAESISGLERILCTLHSAI